ncbi:acyltransferase [Kerstersia gyiorum]|uniref:acyltransferase n=1 Tax=Kerstersia gyiorum TaxID=206506 RepID=UPI00214F9473|nr:acyltransferase [Kerstersia gyiorum]MCR4158983.1 acyltransferase [Kerstersia gyiorum]
MSYISGRNSFEKNKKTIHRIVFFYKKMPRFIRNLVFFIFKGFAGKIGSGVRYIHWVSELNNLGDSAYFSNYLIIKHPKKINIGNNFSIHEFSYLDGAGNIKIGDNVSIAHNCSLISFEHTWGDSDSPIKYCPSVYREISIGDDVWIGCGTRILAGAVIPSRVVIAAGSVVKGVLEPNSIYAGVPAKKIKSI